MMCEVMPTINEGDSVSSQRGSQNGTDAEANFEQLMVNMLDERDKLLESLRETQETLIQSQTKLQDVLHERDVLQRQLNSALPQPIDVFKGPHDIAMSCGNRKVGAGHGKGLVPFCLARRPDPLLVVLVLEVFP
ncbi:liprin-alpha-4 [Pimephales promelas]|nr:liprin-alpha-4 [Pimephales promelas]